jgi:primosomal protein N' (replication factor Y)
MSMYAKVIVDVPVKDANRPFDYRIPDSLVDWVEIGSRVGVPFGPRVLQGFVIEIASTTEHPPGRVKDIQEVLDVEPPLLPELVQLGRWMSEHYLCHWVTALQVMLPTALKGKEEILLRASTPLAANPSGDGLSHLTPEERDMIYWLEGRGRAAIDAFLGQFPNAQRTLKALIRQKYIEETRRVVDTLGTKYITYVVSDLSGEDWDRGLAALPLQAKRQREAAEWFRKQGEEQIRLSDLLSELQISRSVVEGLIQKGLVRLEEQEEYRDPYKDRDFERTTSLPLTEPQEMAYRSIVEALNRQEPEAYLLHGITGSGKTEVYLQSIERCLEQGRQAIVLVPEISLTPQMVERFKSRFGDRVAVLHSRLSHGERFDEWRRIYRGEADVAIGARSAVFAPLRRIGLIVIDEEHESSYKQEDHPKYHAREIALQRSQNHGAVVILGSATPSMETYADAQKKKLRLLTLPVRVADRPLPEVKIVDMRQELREGHRSIFSRELTEAVQDRWERGEQSVLFLNRRGYSTFVLCRSCGDTVECPHCDISLTYHQANRSLRCHYCGYAMNEPRECPTCQSDQIRFFGTGTQKVEEELVRRFPGIRVIRMDVDTTSQKGSHEKWLNQFGRRQADVLLGTQMVAKGLDFPYVTLVGVIAADTVLHLPDFRGSERTFQLLTQVAGRAGRHHLPGEVVIQTYSPEHYSIQLAAQQSYDAFFREELALRKQAIYPPYCRLAMIHITHEDLPSIVQLGKRLVDRLNETKPERKVQIFGPVPSPLSRIKDRYRYQCMLKFIDGFPVASWIQQTLDELEDDLKTSKVHISVDIDPQMLM